VSSIVLLVDVDLAVTCWVGSMEFGEQRNVTGIHAEAGASLSFFLKVTGIHHRSHFEKKVTKKHKYRSVVLIVGH
jgi:hypothetical protein